jgi:Rps23 Pro-64 3,4-dihydroxylase Tpa1-like proline 4-hydroxylase
VSAAADQCNKESIKRSEQEEEEIIKREKQKEAQEEIRTQFKEKETGRVKVIWSESDM